jgi:hypothetical protein
MGLRFLRDTDKRENDFVVLKGNTPMFAVECKKQFKIKTFIKYFFNSSSGSITPFSNGDFLEHGIKI